MFFDDKLRKKLETKHAQNQFVPLKEMLISNRVICFFRKAMVAVAQELNLDYWEVTKSGSYNFVYLYLFIGKEETFLRSSRVLVSIPLLLFEKYNNVGYVFDRCDSFYSICKNYNELNNNLTDEYLGFLKNQIEKEILRAINMGF